MDCNTDVGVRRVLDAITSTLERYRNSTHSSALQTRVTIRDQYQADESYDPLTKSVLVPGGTLFAAYALAQKGMLDRDAAARFEPAFPNVSEHAASDELLLKDVERAARAELTCDICRNRLCVPITAVCGHTFCRVCLHDSVLYGGRPCPVCRRTLAMQHGVNPEARPRYLNIFLLYAGIFFDGLSAEEWHNSMATESLRFRQVHTRQGPVVLWNPLVFPN